ncbi:MULTISPECIES: hypothetical protein [Cylindrospermopsis]|jgi:hypothetical protein|uniref:hypothetical protein n=1 Tax=Cylindrospermopsis TaxID=77021 RepID=UPI00070D4326|nr:MULTISPECIES: hypothetical protein [Cylindrospermopsis]KRH95522.1 hypothetical protein ASL19_11125 [Cylindrospermopsis sp. CR12]MBU6345239.1 hypothetical protein [Cyanobacteria bacterium REEB494]UJL33372.1 hypothetical protein C6N34_015100 [Cylindrospermopsis raciborskii Cr2010]UJS03372.1 hypothetical protein L3I90_09520 [Cylindrospermopsis raciborskii KLL07]
MAHTRNFISNVDDSRVVSQAGHREPLKHLLIGSKKAVISTIHYLHVLGYANATDWSDLTPTGNPGEVMSILVRHIVIN